MKSMIRNVVLCMVALTALQGCTDKDREIAKRTNNGLEDFNPGKPLTEAEIKEWKEKQKTQEKGTPRE